MLGTFQRILDRFRNECLASGYLALLEADVSGWLFHLFLIDPTVKADVHLDTRVCNSDGRFDLVVGELQFPETERPCISPQLVVEIKLFPKIGFTGSQNDRHYKEVLERDIPKLGKLKTAIECRATLIVDGCGYLEGPYQTRNRRKQLISHRDKVAPGVHIFIVRLHNDNWLVEHESPTAASK